MKNLCLLFGIIFLVNFSTAQYSYVYEIRHDNKQPRHEEYSELGPYKYSTGPSEMSRPEASSGPEPKTRDFAVKSPEIGPTLLNMIRDQMQDKKIEQKDNIWSPEVKYAPTSSLALQSNNESPTYARQPSPQSYIKNNELPLYSEKYRERISSPQKGYFIQDSRPLREEPKLYEQRPVYTTYSPTVAPTRAPRRETHDQNDEKMRTVHQIQTPNYRISLVSKPESLDKLLPLLEQYRLSQKPFESKSEPSEIPAYLTGGPSPISSYPSEKQISSSSYSSGPSSYSSGLSSSSYSLGEPSISQYSSGPRSSYKESNKPLVFSVEPDAQIVEPLKQMSVSQIRESRDSRDSRQTQRPLSYSMHDERAREPLRSQRQYAEELKSEPRPILDLPRQELPPQIQQLRGRSIQQLPPREPRGHPLLQSRPSYSKRDQELVPVTALYQMSSPDLSKREPKYSRVEYASEDDSKREGRRPTTSYREEPEIYRIIERPEKTIEMPISDLNEQISKLNLDPSAQKALFDQLKSQSMEMSDRSRTKYGKDEQPLIMTDPNYKPSPIPEEYKPFTQTRYYKTYL